MNTSKLSQTYQNHRQLGLVRMSFDISDGMPRLTIAAPVSCATHGVPCATLPALTAGQTGAAGVVAEFITVTVFIICANT